MKKNRKRQAHARVLPTSFAGLIALCVTLTLIYWAVDSKFNQLGQEVQKSERDLSANTDECMREEAKWNENFTPENLEKKLLQFGIDMKIATAEQYVLMDKSGRLMEEQVSLVAFRKNPKRIEETAQRIDGQLKTER